MIRVTLTEAQRDALVAAAALADVEWEDADPALQRRRATLDRAAQALSAGKSVAPVVDEGAVVLPPWRVEMLREHLDQYDTAQAAMDAAAQAGDHEAWEAARNDRYGPALGVVIGIRRTLEGESPAVDS